MFVLDLARLRRSGPLHLTGTIPVDDGVWEELPPRPEAPVDVVLRAQLTAMGQLLVRGTLEGRLRGECRRCLEPVSLPLHEEVALLWQAPDAHSGEDGDGTTGEDEIRPLEPGATSLEVTGALREELLLRAPRWMVCQEACAGLCPHCGVNRNREECSCTQEDADPRWDALRGLTFDQGK